MTIDPKIDAMLRLRSTTEKASLLVVTLGYDPADFLEAVGDENDVEVLRDVLTLLPLQNVSNIKDGREINDDAQRLVRARIAKIEAAS